MDNYIYIRENFLKKLLFGVKKEAKEFTDKLSKVKDLKEEDFTLLFQAFEDAYGKMLVRFKIGSFDDNDKYLVELSDLSDISKFSSIINNILKIDMDEHIATFMDKSKLEFYKISLDYCSATDLNLVLIISLSFEYNTISNTIGHKVIEDTNHCVEIAKDYFNLNMIANVSKINDTMLNYKYAGNTINFEICL